MKCPACGFDRGGSYNHSKEILKILSTKPTRTVKYIKKLVSEVQQNVPSEYNSKSYFYFLKGINKADNRIVERAIEHYLRAGYHLQGKGFAYVKAMINNEKLNSRKKLQNEYKRLGRTPKIVKIKGNENEKEERKTKKEHTK